MRAGVWHDQSVSLSSPLSLPQRDRRRLGGALWHLADLVQAAERRRSFRAKAFRTAVWSLDELSTDLHEPAEEMTSIPGIGPGVARLIEEFRDTGSIGELERLRVRFPAEVVRMHRLPRATPGRLEALKRGLGVDTVADLLVAIENGAVATIEGLGPATVDRWATILSLPPASGAVPAHTAAVTAARLRRHLMRHLDGDEVVVAGEVRRLEEWVSRIDLVVVTEDPQPAARFLEETAVAATSAVEPGWALDLVTHDRIPVAVRMSDRQAAGTTLIRWTGPKTHVAGLDIDGEAPFTSEDEVYQAVGRDWVPPPARHLPSDEARQLITIGDIRGDLHLHSTWSPDGHMDIDDLAEAALQMDYRYIALTDHTIGLRFGGLDTEALHRQRKLLEATRSRFPHITILHGAEINVDRAGVPDIDDETLGWLDFVVAGCHSHFDLDRREQTNRLVTAVRHPAVRVLAHPSGRRIGIRPGFDVDLSAVFEAAADTGTALEVNGHRDRMDLSAENAAAARAAGARVALNSDAHRFPELDNVAVAVGIMQRAGLGTDGVVNALAHDDFLAWAGR